MRYNRYPSPIDACWREKEHEEELDEIVKQLEANVARPTLAPFNKTRRFAVNVHLCELPSYLGVYVLSATLVM